MLSCSSPVQNAFLNEASNAAHTSARRVYMWFDVHHISRMRCIEYTCLYINVSLLKHQIAQLQHGVHALSSSECRVSADCRVLKYACFKSVARSSMKSSHSFTGSAMQFRSAVLQSINNGLADFSMP